MTKQKLAFDGVVPHVFVWSVRRALSKRPQRFSCGSEIPNSTPHLASSTSTNPTARPSVRTYHDIPISFVLFAYLWHCCDSAL
ncbi:hypothetical protein COCCADRAFT_93413 [Bipolaris zeicola 26-R-13]|uniref:Uncharacterized protein n=1 Tax=Cochliobolus carbonum (strain 26-R-13) TaxID=930089 RepID=W6Y402_COCC2|nr:uncharacterized protein COCCADRAFT_93413 [Bipolaris zeicola 26-R-13]EUC34437.1 hypothetical protein COCCADRAFT_93413 [Bipolaris zeicola 26-R-13]